ncbi:uncharacterized protein LOC135150303 [Daucus carota subsp. sativus]|uniref:uncharacterized protein LOC135150303 n=1 Tax=Daucus carota subsp. sativus TaxID=79200 RepID=UPI0030837FE0
MDHRAKDCPCNNGDGGSGNGGQHNQQNPIGRVFALTSCQAATNPGTVSGTHDSYVLFDTGSTHSVVSLSYVRYLDVLPSLLSPHMSIATPMGTSVIISDVIERETGYLWGCEQARVCIPGVSTKRQVKLISALKAKKLLTKGCDSYLAFVKDTSEVESRTEDYSVVGEYADVFPDELPGLPPHREVEFTIELVPGAEPIS